MIERVIRAKLRADAADAWLDLQPVEIRLDFRVLAIEREVRPPGEAMVRYLGDARVAAGRPVARSRLADLLGAYARPSS